MMETEQLKFEEYKYKEFIHLGFTDHQAKQLAGINAVSVAIVRNVIDSGCAVDTAYKIYRP